jgi:hypothetical protein
LVPQTKRILWSLCIFVNFGQVGISCPVSSQHSQKRSPVAVVEKALVESFFSGFFVSLVLAESFLDSVEFEVDVEVEEAGWE